MNSTPFDKREYTTKARRKKKPFTNHNSLTYVQHEYMNSVDCVMFVLCKTQQDTYKCYVGVGSMNSESFDEEAVINKVMTRGAKVAPKIANQIFDYLGISLADYAKV